MIDGNLLLEALSKEIGCTYLSDLHETENRREVLRAMRKVSVGRYSIQAWNDAVWYITGIQSELSSERAAREKLREFCSKE